MSFAASSRCRCGIACSSSSPACPRNIASIWNMSSRWWASPAYRLRLLLQAFRLQGAHPAVYSQFLQLSYHFVARREAVLSQQSGVVCSHIFRHVHLHLSHRFAPAASHRHVVFAHHVKNHVVVCLVLVVAMQKPVRCLVVNLHIANPQHPVHLYLRIEEVRSGVAVVESRVNHLHRLSLVRGHPV